MRATYAHGAEVRLAAGSDPHALGGAVTVALCGELGHDGSCPLAPHHTAFEHEGALVRLRVLFACSSGDEAQVRERIVAALRAGALIGPDGTGSRWELVGDAPLDLRPEWVDHAARLARG
jgi:hypothetical protein